jgi:4-carboxymuconolactone decarboxylase
MSKDNQRYSSGMNLRRDMFGLGGAEKAVDAASDFSRPLQDLVTEFCFGEVWQRKGLERRERSLLTLALLIGSGRTAQLPMHIRGAKANGATDEEVREVILHCLLYVGIPAAVEATSIAESVLSG